MFIINAYAFAQAQQDEQLLLDIEGDQATAPAVSEVPDAQTQLAMDIEGDAAQP